MSIFMITPKEQVPEAPLAESTVATSAAAPLEVEEQVLNTNDIPDASFVAPKEVDETKIVLDGPLSKIYTDALNMMYAKESYITELVSLDKLKKSKEKTERNKGSYVYVVDGPFLEDDGYVDSFDSLVTATENWENVYVCVEHGMQISDRVAGFLDYSKSLGCEVISDRNAVMSMISHKLSGT